MRSSTGRSLLSMSKRRELKHKLQRKELGSLLLLTLKRRPRIRQPLLSKRE